MPKVRYAVLENDTAQGSDVTSGTETIDLPLAGILQEVVIQVRHKGVYVDNVLLPNYLAIKKLELLVDGSTVVKSLTGRQALALMWYNNGPFEVNNNYQSAANVNIAYDTFILYLGRHQGDLLYGLDLSKFANPQLKITWDVSQTTVDGIVYDANTTDPTFTYNVMAKILASAPDGFTDMYVQSREIYTYNPSADGETLIEIPRGFDLKGIMFGTRYTSKAWNAGMDRVKLDFDNGSWMPIDMDYENIAAAFKGWFPRACHINLWSNRAHNDDFDSRLMQVSGFAAQAAGSGVHHALWGVFEFPLYILSLYDNLNAPYTTNVDMFLKLTGWGPMQTIYIPMKELQAGEGESIDTKEYGRIDLKVTTSGYTASAISRVVAEYFKPNTP